MKRNVVNAGVALKKPFFVSQKNSIIKLNYYLRTISGNTDQYRAKDKNKVSFMLRYNKRSGHKCC